MGEISSNWISQEFSNINFQDTRLVKRFLEIFTEFMNNAQLNISSLFNSWASKKACYRFISNKKVQGSIILQEHINGTILRLQESGKKVLVIHDTTYIDYKTRAKNLSLDRVFRAKKGEDGSPGLILHNSLAVTEEGIPLGLLCQRFIRRQTINHPDRKLPTKSYVHTKSVEEKESYKWIEAIHSVNKLDIATKEVVHIADREGDIYELYRDCDNVNIKFLIRARMNRSINKEKRRSKSTEKLFEYFASLPTMISTTIKFQINKDTKYREADLSISFKQFSLPPPSDRTVKKNGNNLSNILLYGIFVKEKNPPIGEEGLEWFLITNVPVNSPGEALKKVLWYSNRWSIEIFHKILKSGCSIESAQLRERDRLIKYITMKSIVAWKIFWLSRNFNKDDDKNESCSVVLNKLEQQVLFKRFNKGANPSEEFSAKEAIIWIAKLGGYIGRNSDPPPGIISIWRGWTRLMNMVEDYKILINK